MKAYTGMCGRFRHLCRSCVVKLGLACGRHQRHRSAGETNEKAVFLRSFASGKTQQSLSIKSGRSRGGKKKKKKLVWRPMSWSAKSWLYLRSIISKSLVRGDQVWGGACKSSRPAVNAHPRFPPVCSRTEPTDNRRRQPRHPTARRGRGSGEQRCLISQLGRSGTGLGERESSWMEAWGGSPQFAVSG
jgi:hypothetical protein